ncbi:MAG: hypothetical protein CVU57_06045 [Deltaproteobacteria bacterium HGW-Deltaproteobacteria-15]|jgi:hypothetical protein|nr:MAG: hypothetical protein CVU57_06045 [Deltaproteobacteria bacterium HGW-Deltaproteobacteria-15]
MNGCILITKEVLTDPVMLRTEGEPLSFEKARSMADRKARELCPEPMLLAWYDGISARFSPPVECCSEKKPGWIVYAESRGGDITIDINDETFVFIYRCFSQTGD